MENYFSQRDASFAVREDRRFEFYLRLQQRYERDMLAGYCDGEDEADR